MITVPYELLAAHMAFDDADEEAAPAPARRSHATRSTGRSELREPHPMREMREAQRAGAVRRLRAGWAVLNPGAAPALRRRR